MQIYLCIFICIIVKLYSHGEFMTSCEAVKSESNLC